MKKYAALTVQQGLIASEPVSIELQTLYQITSQLVTGQKLSCVQPSNSTTTVFDHHVLSDFEATLKQLKNFESNWSEPPDLLILDLTSSSHSDVINHHLTTSLEQYCQGLQGDLAVEQFVFLIPRMLPANDVALLPLQTMVDQGAAVIVTDSGASYPADKFAKNDSRAQYALALHKASVNPLEKVKRKIIRRVGHFKRVSGNNHIECLAYFYDATYCKKELISLFSQLVFERGQEGLICVDDEQSPWLRNIIFAVVRNLNDQGSAWTAKSISELNDAQFLSGVDQIIAATTMIDSGMTLRDSLSKIRAKNANASISAISIICSEKTDLPEDHHPKMGAIYSGQIDWKGETIQVSSFVRLKQESCKPNNCRACQIGLPFDPIDNFGDGQLNTLQFWKMVDESGIVLERDVRSGRRSVGYVPDFPKLLSQNAAFIALRVRALLNQRDGKLTSTPVLLCPDEAGARELANCLTSLFHFTIVRIPRAILTWIGEKHPQTATASEVRRKATVLIEEGAINRDRWLIQLESLLRRPDVEDLVVIAMDEFNVSGGTRRQISSIARCYGLEIGDYLSLVDFNPDDNSSWSANVVSLYDIDLQEMWVDGLLIGSADE